MIKRPENYLDYWNSYRYMRQVMNTPDWYRRDIPRELTWDSYSKFYEYMESTIGPKPSPRHKLARIDTDRGFVEGNLAWALPQGYLQRSHGAAKLRYRSRIFSIRELSDYSGIEYHRLRRSLRRYHDVKMALKYARQA